MTDRSTSTWRALALTLGILVMAGCLEGAQQSTQAPTPGAGDESVVTPATPTPGAGGAGANVSGSNVAGGGAGGNANVGNVTQTNEQAQQQEQELENEQTFDVRSTSSANPVQNVSVQVTNAQPGPSQVLVVVKEKGTDRIVEQRTVIVERGNTTNIHVDTKGKDNVVVIAQTLTGNATVDVAAQGAQITRIDGDVTGTGPTNIGGTQTVTSQTNVDQSVQNATNVSIGANASAGDAVSTDNSRILNTNVTQTTNVNGTTTGNGTVAPVASVGDATTTTTTQQANATGNVTQQSATATG